MEGEVREVDTHHVMLQAMIQGLDFIFWGDITGYACQSQLVGNGS